MAADLSLALIKLLGAGEYIAEVPGGATPPGHFGLAVKDYTPLEGRHHWQRLAL